HCSLSTGTSPSFGCVVTLPLPSHTLSLQSPSCCTLVNVPDAVLLTPQLPPLHVRWWQSVSVPGQSFGVTQPTQLPLPSHTSPPPQLVPALTSVCDGVPFVHTSSVHALLSSGTSVSSTFWWESPTPSHCC